MDLPMPNQTNGREKAPTTLLEVLLRDAPLERVSYGCGYAYLVESLMSVCGSALSPIVAELDDRPDLRDRLKDVQRLMFEHHALYKATRLAMTKYAEEQRGLQEPRTVN